MDVARVDDTLLDAAEAVLIERGFEGISLERVADRAGRSRVTLWRQGITKDVLVTGLLQRLSDDFQREFWPVLNGSGTGRDRLAACLTALFEVADRHLDLLAVSDEVFHWATERCDFPAGRTASCGRSSARCGPGRRMARSPAGAGSRTWPMSRSTRPAGATSTFATATDGRANGRAVRSRPSSSPGWRPGPA